MANDLFGELEISLVPDILRFAVSSRIFEEDTGNVADIRRSAVVEVTLPHQTSTFVCSEAFLDSEEWVAIAKGVDDMGGVVNVLRGSVIFTKSGAKSKSKAARNHIESYLATDVAAMAVKP